MTNALSLCRWFAPLALWLVLVFLVGCGKSPDGPGSAVDPTPQPGAQAAPAGLEAQQPNLPENPPEPASEPAAEPVPAGVPGGPPVLRSSPEQLIQPEQLVYQGAFRLPDHPDDERSWNYSGEAVAYCPVGDPDGPDDGYPGSLFAMGHDWRGEIGEVSIPVPVVSEGKNVEELNTAATLQDFGDVKGEMFPALEIIRCGLAYLPKQGQQTSGKLYFCYGQHMAEDVADPSHGWCELDLSNPRSAGPWRIDDLRQYVTTDYLFDIPSDWADANAPGMLLATGRFRDGGQGTLGPSLFAFGPWSHGNPPEPGAKLAAKTLLRYSSVYDEEQHAMRDYHHADEWSGGAWLTAGDRAAVVFVGTKGQGECWYGFADGTVWPDEAPFPEIPPPPNDQRGWWSTRFVGQMIFYDPAQLAAVARGDLEACAPQPYAVLNLDEHLFRIASPQQKTHVRAAAFDRARALLYVFEFRGDEDKSLVHVWRVQP